MMESAKRFPLLRYTSSPEASPHKYGTMAAQQPTPTPCLFTPPVCSALSQLWACGGKYLCMLNIGLVASLPLLLVPLASSGAFHFELATADIQNLVSIIYIVMPIGSVLAALPIKTTRKPPIIMSQATMAASWLGTYYSTQPWHLLTARAFGGLAMTLSQPHIACYIGEVTVPELRGVYSSLTQTMGILGALIVSSLVYIHSFHIPVIICGFFAILSTVYLFFIPESPLLLIEQEKYKKAFKSLKQLRGGNWADENEVKEEFYQLLRHYAQKGKNLCTNSKILDESLDERDNYFVGSVIQQPEDQNQNVFLSHTSLDNSDINWKNSKVYNDSFNGSLHPAIFPSQDLPEYFAFNGNCRSNENLLVDETAGNSPAENESDDDDVSWFRFLLTPSMYRPFAILAVAALFVVGPGSHAINTYLVYILSEYHLQKYYDPILTMITCGMLAGNVGSTCLVAKLGKKVLIILSAGGSGLGYAGLAGASYLGAALGSQLRLGLVGFLLVWTIFMEEFGLRTLYHSLLAELFPMRGKKIGASLIVLLVCMNGILVGQKFLALLSAWGATGVMSLNLVLSFSAAVFFFLFFVETEGKTLKEIENHFKGR